MSRTHPLAEWIDARMSRAAFAQQLGVSESHLSLILQRKRGLSLKLAMAIERATERAVTASALNSAQPQEAAPQ